MTGKLTTWYRALLFDSEAEYEALIASLSSSEHAANAIAINHRGVARAEIGQLDEALDDFRAASELAPDAGVPHMNRGDLLARHGRHDEALAEYAAAIRLEPADAYFRRSRAHLLHRLGQYDAAIADYDDAIRAQPDFLDFADIDVRRHHPDDNDPKGRPLDSGDAGRFESTPISNVRTSATPGDGVARVRTGKEERRFGVQGGRELKRARTRALG